MELAKKLVSQPHNEVPQKYGQKNFWGLLSVNEHFVGKRNDKILFLFTLKDCSIR